MTDEEKPLESPKEPATEAGNEAALFWFKKSQEAKARGDNETAANYLRKAQEAKQRR